jgi:arylsulfatase A-like enzyme
MHFKYARIAGAWLTLVVTLLSSVLVADARQPNIIVIVGDDMGYADIGIHGCKDIPTPNIDALANAGVRCTNGYVSGPYCSPTRAGLLTGRYQTRFGHEFNPGGGGKQANKKERQVAANDESQKLAGLPLTQTTIADRLKNAGYVTGLVGKWHLGAAPQMQPQQRGFDEFFGFLGGAHGYMPGNEPPILRGTDEIDEKEYLTDAIGREAVAFVNKHAGQPFFLYTAFNAVHTPMHATDDRLQKFAGINDEKRRTYAAMMSAMDDAIGKLMQAVRDNKLDGDTLVFFISDNGGPTMKDTSLNASSNAPLRGSKRTTLEGGVRVPFLVKWPGHVPAGKTYEQPVIQLDILPTALAAASVDNSHDAKFDGVDLLPYLRGEKDGRPHDSLFWRFGEQMAIRQGDWKLVRYDPVVDGETGSATAAKLYNLADDIGEKNDLITKEPAKAKALQAAWDEWNKSNIAPLWGKGAGKKQKLTKRQGRAARRAVAAEASGR